MICGERKYNVPVQTAHLSPSHLVGMCLGVSSGSKGSAVPTGNPCVCGSTPGEYLAILEVIFVIIDSYFSWKLALKCRLTPASDV